jgi:glycosyltransferase involved in cell wall biosynthesis
VQFDDPVPKAQVGEVLRQADAFILNNRKDAVSRNWMSFNKLYEYLAAGRPVVFGSFSASDPVRESGAGISVPADSPSELAAAVAYLAQLPSAQLAGYGRRGREHIEQNYSIVRLVDVFEGMAFEVTGLQRPLDAMADVQPTLEQRA